MPEVESAPAPEVEAPAQPVPVDPFSLDENSLVSLSPEQRAALDPIMDGWRKKALDEISKRESAVSEKYKPLEEKAVALDKLVNYQPFVQWWHIQQQQAGTGATPEQKQAIQQTTPQQIASPQEWQDAILEASSGDATKLQNLQAKMMREWATPVVNAMNERQATVETKIEMQELFENHPDAKELDKIGLDEKGEGISLLETAFDWAERNGKSLEEGYQLATRWRNNFQVSEQKKAMGLVQEKKGEVTAGPSTASGGTSVVEVGSADELIQKSLEAQLAGNKNIRFVIKGK